MIITRRSRLSGSAACFLMWCTASGIGASMPASAQVQAPPGISPGSASAGAPPPPIPAPALPGSGPLMSPNPPPYDDPPAPGAQPHPLASTIDPAAAAGIFFERRYQSALTLLRTLAEPFDSDLKRALIEDYLAAGADGPSPSSQFDLSADPRSCSDDLRILGMLTVSLLEPEADPYTIGIHAQFIQSASRADYGLAVASPLMQQSGCSAGAALPILDELFRALLIHLQGEQFVIREGSPTTELRETVSLEITEKGKPPFRCSGALVSPCKVLTASHCMLSKKQFDAGGTITVSVLGPTQTAPGSKEKGTRVFTMKDTPLLHPNSDMAVVTLTERVKRAPSFLPVLVKNLDEINKEREEEAKKEGKAKPPLYLKIVGFGRTTDGSIGTRRTGIVLFRKYDTSSYHFDPEKPEMEKPYPAMFLDPFAPYWDALCGGDSGGPVLYQNQIVGTAAGGRRDLGLRTVCVKGEKDKGPYSWWVPKMEDLTKTAIALLDDKTFSKNAIFYPPYSTFGRLAEDREKDPKRLEMLATSYHMAQNTCGAKEGYRLPTAFELRTALVQNITEIHNKSTRIHKFDPAVEGAELPVVSGDFYKDQIGEPLDLTDPDKPLWLPVSMRKEVFGYWVATERPAKDPRKEKELYDLTDFLAISDVKHSYAEAYAQQVHFRALLVGPDRRTGRSPGKTWATDDNAFFPIVRLHNVLSTDCERSLSTDIAASLYHANQAVKDVVDEKWVERNISEDFCKGLTEVSLEDESQTAAPAPVDPAPTGPGTF